MTAGKRSQGITLIELLIVIIIGILVAIAIPMYLSQTEKARKASVKKATHHTQIGLQCWAKDHGASFPGLVGVTTDVSADLRPAVMDGRPGKAWSKNPIDTSPSAEGDVAYARQGLGFTLVGHGQSGVVVSSVS